MESAKKDIKEIKQILKSDSKRIESHDKKFDLLLEAIKDNGNKIDSIGQGLQKLRVTFKQFRDKQDQILELLIADAEGNRKKT